MWKLTNKTPYALGKSWVRDQSGVHVWLVAVKATFDILQDAKLRLSDDQSPALLAPQFWADPATSSLRYEADVVPPKPTTDVLLEGSAYAPTQRPTAKVPVSLRVGDLEKVLLVHGPRVYRAVSEKHANTSHAQPFIKTALRYESAYGGSDLADPDPRRHRFDSRNPVGRGVASDLQKLVGTPAHTLEYPDGDPSTRGPAGYGPIASFWSPRREHAGTYGREWETTRKPLLPNDYDERHLLSAPEDQRTIRHLVGGEWVRLKNVTPEGLLQFQLPRITPLFKTTFGRRTEEHLGSLGTVLLEPDSYKLKMVWQTALCVPGPQVDYLDQTIVSERSDR